MLTVPIFIGCSFDVTYDGARLAADDTPLDAGVCTWNLYSADKATSLADGVLSRTNGDYAGAIPPTATAALVEKTGYWVKISFAQGGVGDTRWIPCRAAYRSDQ